MSLNDHKEVRRIFAGFKIQPVTRRCSVSRNKRGTGNAGGELLIGNYWR